ncbi:hypothetical protein GCM10007874_61130 [Labrys miyagiensis]|uniref:Uncharacterized protein n=1 Tax=Labrys miyagiensis TaxID=346912 RepID=A0ABQ6CTG4_9HYPH|nr:hypothetical protein [Labrys miyagiensis]GLS23093.1 hypothetical protein GCM10007874_61130 [Labrys miyagiensis]
MPRVRLKVSGITTLEEARIAVEAGADAIGLDPLRFATTGMTPDEAIAEIALSLPPAVTAVVQTRALTAGAVAQQVDAGAATAVQLMRPLPASEYPGLKRIIRGRKIIQSIKPEQAQALELAAACAEFADAVHLPLVAFENLPRCRQIAEICRQPVFLGLVEPERLSREIADFRPFAIDVVTPGGSRLFDPAFLAKLA